jgi:DNA-binding NarL/FixJ family response regulator
MIDVPEVRPGQAWGTWPPPNPGAASQVSAQRKIVVRTIVVQEQAAARRNLLVDLRLEPNLEVVGEANTAASGVALAQDQRPDIVVMDVEMPVVDGVQAAERLHALAPDCLIMLLTVRDSLATHERGRAAGARVVLQKGSPAIFRSAVHDLVEFVRARNMPAWPEIIVADAQ